MQANETHAMRATAVNAHDATPRWRFDHVNVSAGDGRALRKLFEGVMGFAPGHRPPFPFPGEWLYEGGQAVVHVVDDARLTAAEGEVRFGHIAFRSDEPAAPLIARLRAGALPLQVALVPQDALAQLFVVLPGGFVVELQVPADGIEPDHCYDARRASPNAADF